MTQPDKPISVDAPDGRPPAKTGMTLRRKLVLLAVPTVLAVVSVPVGIAHAHGTVQNHVAAATTVHIARIVVATHAVAPKTAAKTAAAEPIEGTDPATESATEATTDPAADPTETGTDTGHSDEVAGSTTESNVDHQFNGQE